MSEPDNGTILVVEDDQALGALIVDELAAVGYRSHPVSTLADARAWLDVNRPVLLVTDLRLPDGNGIELVCSPTGKGEGRPRPGLIVITAFGSVRQAVEALQAGADDFLTKPLDLDHFVLSVRRVLESCRLREEVERFRELSVDDGFHGIFGRSPAMTRLFAQIRVMAQADGPVLIQGESGTGKELVARALHEESPRRKAPFVIVNCAGVPPELLESEFFGHAAGAFTGANRRRKGLLQEADGGTLLLDEIGEMPLALQAKLLRALQDGSIRPVGQDREARVDVRMIAATHKDLKRGVEAGQFREDLYYRLETFVLDVPPLRARGDDLELLAQRFLRELSAGSGRLSIEGFSDDALRSLREHSFPGNVRELRNMIERAVAFCSGGRVLEEHLPVRRGVAVPPSGDAVRAPLHDLSFLVAGPVLPTLDQLQIHYLKWVLGTVGGNKRRAAALLGIGRRTLYRWLDEKEARRQS